MKKIALLLILSLISFKSIGQENPELFRTWHLYFVLATDLDTPYEVSEIQPPIRPFITISETNNPEIVEIIGEGACNSFSGTYSHTNDPSYPEILSIDFTNTQDDCGLQLHNSFEDSFFGFMGGGWYDIQADNQGFTLRIDNPLMGYALFKSYPLSISEKEISKFKIFPNPANNDLYVLSEKAAINSISIISINGRKVLKTTNTKSAIDVSSLSKGLYFLEIIALEGRYVQKFIKN